MKTRTLLFVIMTLCAMIILAGCGKKHYSAYKAALTEIIAAKEKFINEAQSASTAEALATAMKNYSTSIDSFKAKRTELFTKYPQLTDRGPHPDDVVKLLERSALLDEKIDSALIPAMEKYPNDANIISAWNELLHKRASL
ncbi:MAG: hypothetical protein N2316_10705 [Spirochaetes bacterium]|nr:hypothetical protein [Spirochaetota bacterium]